MRICVVRHEISGMEGRYGVFHEFVRFEAMWPRQSSKVGGRGSDDGKQASPRAWAGGGGGGPDRQGPSKDPAS